MTPDDLIHELHGLVRAGQFRAVVELTIRVLPDIRSQMTPEHANQLHEIMHVADTVADLEDAAGDTASTDPEVAAGRPV
jgi:hypothetical protein